MQVLRLLELLSLRFQLSSHRSEILNLSSLFGVHSHWSRARLGDALRIHCPYYEQAYLNIAPAMHLMLCTIFIVIVIVHNVGQVSLLPTR